MSNEPAFPTPNGQFFGMSLRDWFAGQALPEAYADAMRNEAWTHGPDWRIGLALDAYETADAMLKAREIRPEHAKTGGAA